jgi:hypothetical protein
MAAARVSRGSKPHHRKEQKMSANYKFLTVLLIISCAIAAPAFAGKGGKPASANAGCTVAGNVVSAAGLPTGQVINFMTSNAGGSSGWVLGYTSDGNWSINVPAPNGATTYQFVSTTWGPDGSKYNVFASCSA